MVLNDTAEMMCSPDYKERFRAEYFQLKMRYDGLTGMLFKYKEGTLNFVPSCSYELLSSQADAMKIYMNILEDRATVENIDLEVINDKK